MTEKKSFNDCLNEIERIISKLENDNGETLEKYVELFKKGVNLCGHCKQQLNEAKLEIQYVNDEVIKN